MTFKEFINQFDKDNSIVLLEGKRNVLETDKQKLISLGKLLASTTSKMLFRSGNADGADYYFSLGISSDDNSRLQVIIPYKGHRQKSNLAYDTISLDEINVATELEVVNQSKSNKKMKKLVDQYISGARDQYSIKAAYIVNGRDKLSQKWSFESEPL